MEIGLRVIYFFYVKGINKTVEYLHRYFLDKDAYSINTSTGRWSISYEHRMASSLAAVQFDDPRSNGCTLVGRLGDKIVGVIPLFQDVDVAADQKIHRQYDWVGMEDFVGFTPSVLPEYLEQFIHHLPPVQTYDISVAYKPTNTLGLFEESTSWAIDLSCYSNLQEYLDDMKAKPRSSLTKSLRDNADINVEPIILPHRGVASWVREKFKNSYEDYWVRCDIRDAKQEVENQKSLGLQHQRLYPWYPELKETPSVVTMQDFMETLSQFAYCGLVGLDFQLNGKTVAANFSLHNEHTGEFTDYICVRDPNNAEIATRGLGIFAIVKNIEEAIKRKARWYNLSDGPQPYKKKFIIPEKPVTYTRFSKASTESLIYLLADGQSGWTPPYVMFDNTVLKTVDELQEWLAAFVKTERYGIIRTSLIKADLVPYNTITGTYSLPLPG